MTLDEMILELAGEIGKWPHALIVDDDRDFTFLFSRTLKKLGFQVSECATGKEAIDYANVQGALSHRPFDIVFLDMKLPDMSGRELEQFFEKFYPSVPVACISGADEITRQWADIGCQLFLSKDKLADEEALRNLFRKMRIKIKSNQS